MITDQDHAAMVEGEARFFRFIVTVLWRWPGFLVFLLELQWLHPHPVWGECIVFGGTLWAMAFLYNWARRPRDYVPVGWRERFAKFRRLVGAEIDQALATWAAQQRAAVNTQRSAG